jgi:hypothetical protein
LLHLKPPSVERKTLFVPWKTAKKLPPGEAFMKVSPYGPPDAPVPGTVTSDHWYASALATSGPARRESSSVEARAKIFLVI